MYACAGRTIALQIQNLFSHLEIESHVNLLRQHVQISCFCCFATAIVVVVCCCCCCCLLLLLLLLLLPLLFLSSSTYFILISFYFLFFSGQIRRLLHSHRSRHQPLAPNSRELVIRPSCRVSMSIIPLLAPSLYLSLVLFIYLFYIYIFF